MTILPSTVIALFVINGNEYSAASRMLEQRGWQTTGRELMGGLFNARFAYRGMRYRKVMRDDRILELDLVRQDVSSNLPMSVSAMLYFDFLERDLQETYQSSSSYPVRYAILYGCAGAPPKAHGRGGNGETASKRSTSGITYHPPVGDVVIVEEATWMENGEWVTEQRGGELIDVQRSKADRHSQFRAECPSDLRNLVHIALGIPQVSALCVDKVVKLKGLERDDVATKAGHLEGRPTLRELLRQGYGVVDMESYGFLACVPGDLRNVLVLRVLTDTLGSKADPASDVLQSDLLVEHAATTLSKVVSLIEEQTPQGKEPSGQADAAAVSGVMLQLARRMADLTREGRVPRSPELDEVLSVASMRLADFGFGGGGGSQAADADEQRLFEIASNVIRADERGYATERFRGYAGQNVFEFLQVDPVEADFEYAYEGWEAFCRFIAPSSLEVDYRRYRKGASRALARVCDILNQEPTARRVKSEKAGDLAAFNDRLVFAANLVDMGSGEVIILVRMYSSGTEKLPERDTIGQANDAAHLSADQANDSPRVLYILWDGFESDDSLLDAVRSVVR